ncbi:TetR/AcrR family transcriptional regulator [Ottowia sp.]|uniref:TetR/AcrR family transcriptional regulator n=1 Tax=Ottowia sp. TaxID=1898956 RepID=UPI0039E2FFBC
MPRPLPSRPAAALVRRRTQAERREEAEQKLLEAALQIVARRGSVRMTLAEVGEAAGYSRGLPAQRFGSKAGLLRALASSIGTRFVTKLMQAPAQPGLNAIRAHVRVYFNRRDDDWTTTRALLVMMTEGLMEASELREIIAGYNRARADAFERDLRHAIELGEVDPGVDPKATAVLLLGMLRGVMMQWLLDPAIRLEAVRDEMLAMIDALSTPRAAPRRSSGRRVRKPAGAAPS